MWPITIPDLDLYRGDTFTSPPIRLHALADDGTTFPLDLDGWEFRATLSTRWGSHPLVVETAPRAERDGLPVAAEFVLIMPAEEAAHVVDDGTFDVQGTHEDGTVRTWLRGRVCVRRDVTK